MDSRQQVIQDMFGVSRLLVLKKYFINQNFKCILKMFWGNMFEENIFSNTFSEIKRICYRKRCAWFSNNVKTGNVRRHTLRRLAKLVVTIYTIKKKVLGSDFKFYVASTLYRSNQRIKIIIKDIGVIKHVLFLTQLLYSTTWIINKLHWSEQSW